MNAAPPDPDDDQQWFDLLAGRHATEPDRRTAQEAAWLRAALLAYRGQAPAGAPAAPDERVARLLGRARAAGLVPTPTASGSMRSAFACRACRAFRRAWPWSIGAAALAATLALLVAPGGLRPPADRDEAVIMRGDAVQVRRSSQPAVDREAMRAALRAAGIDAAPYERLDRLGLDVELPQQLTPTQRDALTGLGLPPAVGPALRIEFSSEGSSP